jgi:signal transduction histidine kinase
VVDVAVKQAAYGIVAEAVRNAVRHADASSCEITVRESDDGLVITVADDGVGLPQQLVSGVGLLSMRERADGIGAALNVTSAESGTVVELRVPSLANSEPVLG